MDAVRQVVTEVEVVKGKGVAYLPVDVRLYRGSTWLVSLVKVSGRVSPL